MAYASVSSAVRSLLRTTAVAGFVVYVGWNAFWIAQATVPPSLLVALTGLPSPTTGGTRSLEYLLAGDWSESLRCNAMTVPIILLFAASLGCLAWQRSRGQRMVLPRWIAWNWGIVLLLAWLLKLCSDTRYW